ncbi:type II and III secretion system protein family protein [Sphingobium estronivorans]|uniref:type II and III secretion system protein family protein n=1 Tax=Sphingobium estronivorans TaxID=1577690 RepID=UPI001F07C384|nr:type II and III secretion system protein family protein [Sphingobium estronivorans]
MATDRQSRALRSGGFLIALGLALAAATPMTAQAQMTAGEASLHAGTLEVPLNKSQVVTADRPIAKAMVGNDEVADIMPITNRSVYVLGKKMGTTSLTLYDGSGRVISVIDVSVGPDVLALSDQLRQLVPGEKIDTSISNDSVVLTGLVSNPAAADRAAMLAKAYAGDKVINLLSVGSSTQVMVEVRFAEVSRTAGKEIGVSGFGLSNNGKFDAVTGKGASLVPDPDTGVGIMKLAEITNTFGIFRNVFNVGGTQIEAVLNALESRGLAKTLAQPTLIALSGEKASFLAGGEFPVPSVQSGGSTNGNTPITVQFKPFGVSLSFTPTVLGDRTINMIVEPEVSQIDSSASLTVGNITIPGLRTRRASTTLELRDGESFAIAGLLQKDFKTTVDQIPLLGSIPILGALFRSTNYQKGQTELLIVVTPHLVAPLKPGQVRLPTDTVRDPSEAETFLLGQAYHPKPLKPVAPVDGAAAAAPAASPSTAKGGSYAY